MPKKSLQRLCLRPTYSLKWQLLLSFGSATSLCLTAVLVVSIVISIRAGSIVKERASLVMRRQVEANLAETTHYTADSFSEYMENKGGASELVSEYVRDLIVGYPNEGWENDLDVPFRDSLSGLNVYPLDNPPAPLEWNITLDLSQENADELLQERALIASSFFNRVTLTSGSYFMRGACNPAAVPGELTFVEGCTDANNDVLTGGVFAPSPTNYGLYQRSGDLSILMRPLYESHDDILLVGMYYVNSGAGSSTLYPGVLLGNEEGYESLGCEWMREINPFTNAPYGTEEMMQRCHPAGSFVERREYNPLERDWFQAMVAGKGEIVWFGPYESNGGAIKMIAVGKAVYDRKTGELIGCTSVDLAQGFLNDNIATLKPFDDWRIQILKYDDIGTIVADSEQGGLFNGDMGGLHASLEHLQVLKRKVEDILSEDWTTGDLRMYMLDAVANCTYGVMAGYPVPVPPATYDPTYRPQYLVVEIASEAIFMPITDFEDSINSEILQLAFVTVTIGIFGLAVTLAFVYFVAGMLTQPLVWIASLSKRIVNHADQESGEMLHLNAGNSTAIISWWSPNTEIMDLVAGFGKMVKGFSGDHPPSVAENDFNEVRNGVTWQSDFGQLYEKDLHAKPLHSNVTAVTPLTEEESGELSAGNDDEELALPPARLPIKGHGRESTSDIPHWQSDFSHSFRNQNCLLVERPQATKDRDNEYTATASGEERHLSFVGGSSKPPKDTALDESKKQISVVPAPPKQNLGRNIPVKVRDMQKTNTDGWFWVSRSKLFRWMLLLLVTPLIIAITAICVLVTTNIVSTVLQSVDTLSYESRDLSLQSLTSVVTLKALVIERMIGEPIRDLHQLSRLSNWIHSRAVQRSGSFTEVDHAAEDCKSYGYFQCPLYDEPGRFPCPCDWDDALGVDGACTEPEPPNLNTRPLQRSHYTCQSTDANPLTGERAFSYSFPLNGNAANTTAWWGDVEDLPGISLYGPESSYSSTYERLRVASSFGPVTFPLYNYATESGRPKSILGTFAAYESDGLFTGYTGCSANFPNSPLWKSTPENRASIVRPELCPLGKHGYDPRCRPWYTEARRRFLEKDEFVHITAPYLFSDEETFGLSAVSPLVDSATGTFIGQVLLDFRPNGVRQALNDIREPISFLITRESDAFGGDTVVGPDRSKGWSSAMITDLVYPDSNHSVSFQEAFESSVLLPMKKGEAGTSSFLRRGEDGIVVDYTVVFAPVRARFLHPVDASDITRGVTVSITHIHSLAIAVDKEEMLEPFRVVKDATLKDLKDLAGIDTAFTIFIAIIFIGFAFRVSIHATKPMILLVKVVESINSGEAEDDIPPLEGGSREFSQVYTSFSKLNKVVGVSNKAFFSGKLDWAYHFISDALLLFRKLDDQKAIGVACNNLGNTIFALAIRGRPLWKTNLIDDTSVTILTALDYYDEAIGICQRDLDSATGSEEKAEYAQHLADRFFNRGMYLLFIENDPDAPEDVRRRALDDIASSRDLDYDVRDYLLEKKLLFQHSDIYFWRLLRRIFGLSTHVNDEEIQAVWNVRELVGDADSLLFTAWNEPSAPVFRDLGPVNRLQQLEIAALRLEVCNGHPFEAARMAMRMLVEDEFILECCLPVAVSAFLQSSHSSQGINWSDATWSSMCNDFRKMSATCKGLSLDLGRCGIFALELNERWEGSSLLNKVKSHCFRIFDECFKDEDHVGVAAYTVRGDPTICLQSKACNYTQQRAMLDMATTSTSEMVSPCLPFAMQMIMDSAATLEKDTFVFLLTDGYSWDRASYSAINHQIDRLNRERKTSIHLIILGFDIEDEEVVHDCQSMCTLTKSSSFVEVTEETVDAVFASVIATVNPPSLTGPVLQSLTMEKF